MIIKLTNSDLPAIIDDEDYDLVISHGDCWHLTDSGPQIRSRILPRIRRRLQKISMHRLVMNQIGINLHLDIDHINRNNLDNRKSNLRLIEHRLNIVNCEKSVQGSTSKFKGVSWHTKANKFQVHVMVNGKRLYGGLFTNEIEAAKKANELYKNSFGDIAVLNVI